MILISFCLCLADSQGYAKENDNYLLEFDKVKHYLVSIEAQLAGVAPQGEMVWTFLRKGSVFVESKYNEQSSDPDLGFGTLKDPMEGSSRVPLAEGEKDRRIRGARVTAEAKFFLDSAKRQILSWDKGKSRWQAPIDIIMDMVRPPADARGEAPRAEIERTRARFLKSYRMRTDDPEFIVGMTDLPEHWRDRDGSHSLVLLKHQDFPLASLKCQTESDKNCRFMRVCFMPKLSLQEVENLSGIAYRKKTRELWIALNEPPRIIRFSAKSCLGVSKLGVNYLPKELRKMSGLAIDEKDRIWITTAEADLKHSASLFIWQL